MNATKKSKVWYAALDLDEPKAQVKEKLTSLARAIPMERIVGNKDYVAIKMHFGEGHNDTHVPPFCVRPIIDVVHQSGGAAFLTDTNVLYRSQRSNAVSHLRAIENNGFTIRKLGAPIIIGDGLLGDSEITVAIPGKIYQEVSLARNIMLANALVAISHVTGHMGTGMGATIKNLGMGIASRKGKLRQHSTMKPKIRAEKCTGCEVCLRWCPQDTIEMQDGVAFIKTEGCIGCGECLTVCNFDAVSYNWAIESEELQKRTAEHALGAVFQRRDKSAFFNFVTDITKDCDCLEKKQHPVMDDIGVLASTDPVAIDKAALDLVAQRGTPLHEYGYPHLDPLVQLRHGEEIGLGSMEYELVEVK